MNAAGGDWRPTISPGILRLRAQLLAELRHRFAADGLLEVETPYLGHAPVTDPQIDSLTTRVRGQDAPLYLQTSPEYAMKRLLAAGSGDIYQIARVFRDGELGRRHNPEFTLVEWYRLGMDHRALAGHVVEVLSELLTPRIGLGPAEWLTYRQALQRYAGLDPDAATTAALLARLAAGGIDVPPASRGERDDLLDLLLGVEVIPRLGRDRLTVVLDYPPSQAALARIGGDPPVAARFEVFAAGLELANGFHELADPIEQRRRFEADIARRRRLGRAEPPLDERLLAALGAGLPECAGVAVGFDRLVMLAAGATDIADVLSFPLQRA